ncbi:GUN4 domain-containing protein [Mastigocoleus testarum]|uniref:GUN4 domain-containing protein n=1 Tax=Mastigocoleus testarum TaxID=996925 RepID=UPI003898E6B4
MDYTYLQDLLKAEQWKEADRETLAVMLKAADREKQGWFNNESIDNFPCNDLRTINQLWIQNSNRRFGFSVQKRIWESVGRDYEKFGEQVGWRKGMLTKQWLYYREITFNINAPLGHLPTFMAPNISSCWGPFARLVLRPLGFFSREDL